MLCTVLYCRSTSRSISIYLSAVFTVRGLRREKDAILSKESHHIFIAVYYLVFFYYNCCWGEEEEEKKRGRTIYEPFSLPSCLLFSSSSSYFFTDLLWKASTCLHGSSSFSVLEMCEYGYIYFRLDFFVYRKHIFVRRDRMGWDCEIGCWSARCLRPSFAILPTRWRWQMWRLWNRKPIIRNDCRRRGEGYSFLNLRKKEGERERQLLRCCLLESLLAMVFFLHYSSPSRSSPGFLSLPLLVHLQVPGCSRTPEMDGWMRIGGCSFSYRFSEKTSSRGGRLWRERERR